MKAKHPKTRTEAAAPQAVRHLAPAEQEALEMSEEAEHHDGTRRERIVKESERLSEKSAE